MKIENITLLFWAVLVLVISMIADCSNSESADEQIEEETIVATAISETPTLQITINTPTPPKPTILFEVSYHNAAWGFNTSGFYIDAEGNVVSYEHKNPALLPDHDAPFTKAELITKYGNSTQQIATVSQDDLIANSELIKSASAGKLSDPVRLCYDFGTFIYLAYFFDEGQGQYNPITLYQTGDVAQRNLSEDAEDLVEWLDGIVEKTEFSELRSHCTPEQ